MSSSFIFFFPSNTGLLATGKNMGQIFCSDFVLRSLRHYPYVACKRTYGKQSMFH